MEKGWESSMSVEVYAAFAYAFTAVISFAMIGSVVLLNKMMGSGKSKDEEEDS